MRKIKQTVRKYLLNILISMDQTTNTITGGDPDETISSRLGKIERWHDFRIPWYLPLTRFLVWLLNKLDPAHCQKSIEEDEGRNGVIPPPGGKKNDSRITDIARGDKHV